jgi:hypothetical protein
MWSGPLHLTFPGNVAYACTNINKWHEKKKKKKKKKKVTLHMLTHGTMRGRGLTSLVVCINDKIRDTRKRKRDNKERDLNYAHPFPRVWGD